MLDSTTDDAMLERIHADAPGSLEFRKPRKRIVRQTREALTNVRPANLADRGCSTSLDRLLTPCRGTTTLKTLDLDPVRRFNAGAVTLGAMNGR